MAVASSTPRVQHPWYTATLGGMASYLDAATIVSVAIAMVLFQQQFGLSALMVGVISSALALSFATGAIIGGRLGDVLGRRRVYSVDLIIYAAGVLTVILSPNGTVLLIGIIVTGLAMGADVPTSLALVAEEAPKGRQGGAVAYSQTLWLVGVAAVQVIAFFVADMGGLGARILFVHLLVVSVVVWIMRRGVVESPIWEQTRRNPTSVEKLKWRAAFRKPYGLALLATGLFFLASGILPNTIGQFGPFLIVNLAHSTARMFTVIGLATLVVGIAIALLFQRMVDGPARKVFLVTGLIALIVGPLAAVIGGFTLASLVVLYFANTIGGTWAGEGMYKVWSQEIFPTEIRSTAQGLTYGVARYAMAAVGVITPLLSTTVPGVLFGGLAVLGAVSAVIALLWIPRLPRDGKIDHPEAEVPALAIGPDVSTTTA